MLSRVVDRLLARLHPFWLFLLAPLALFGGTIIRGRALYWGTPALQFVPWVAYAWEQVSGGTLPSWNPLNGMGAPLLANYQLAFFYPPLWLLFPLWRLGGAPWLAWGFGLLVVLHLGWAGLGMASLCRRLGLGLLAQMVGGLAFGLCGYLVARAGFFSMIWTGAWLPWVLFGASALATPVDRAGEGAPLRFPWLFSLCLGLQLLAGHAQLSWYTMTLAAAWLLVGAVRSGARGRALKVVALAAAGGLLAALLAAVQLLPTMEYLLQSQRSSAVDYDVAMSYSFWPWRLLSMLAPDFFGNPGQGDYWGYASQWEDAVYLGILPLLLALGTIRMRRDTSYRALVCFLWAVIVVTLPLALGRNTPVFPFLYRYVPTFAMFKAPARMLIWMEFALALLAAIGAEVWARPVGRGLKRLKQGIAAAFALTLGAGLSWLVLREVEVSFVRATALAGIWIVGAGLLTLRMPPVERVTQRTRWMWLALIWLVADLLAAGWLLNPSVPAAFYAGETPELQVLRSQAGTTRLYLSASDEYWIKFRRFLRMRDYRPVEDLQHIRQTLLPNLNLLDGVAAVNNFDPLVPGRYARWMEMVDGAAPEERASWLQLMNVGWVETVDLQSALGVKFEQVQAGARFTWVGCSQRAAGEEQALQAVQRRLTGLSRSQAVILEGEATLQDTSYCDAAAPALKVVIDEPGRTVVRVDGAGQAGWLVQRDSWYPGWAALVDGTETTVERADYLFRAVFVPAGGREVELVYRPLALRLGAIVSALGWTIVAVSWFVRRRSSG